MKEDTGKNKLSNKHKAIVLEMLAAYEPVQDIVEHLKAEFEIDTTSRNIYYYAERRYDEIKEIRAKLNMEFESIPVANKYNRLKTRQRLIDDLMRQLETKGKHEIINKILDSIQKEVEPSKIALTATTGENEFRTIDEAREEVKRRLHRLYDRKSGNGN